MDDNKRENNEINSDSLPDSSDDFVIGSGFKVDDTIEHDQKPMPVKKKRQKSGCLKAVGWLACLGIIAVLLATTIILFVSDYFGIGIGRGVDCVVEIKQGMGTKQIAEVLKEENAVSSSFLFRVYSKLKGYDGTYKYGVYTFNNEIGYEAIAHMLQTDGAKAETATVKIPEGATIDEIAKLLEQAGVCSASQFRSAVRNTEFKDELIEQIPVQEVYYRLEGYLFPDTYNFFSYDNGAECAQLAVRKMVEQTLKKITPDMRKKAQDMGYTVHEVLTMASIVELEASGTKSEMHNVAAVFYNRLSWDEPKLLGSSPTAEYPYGNGRYDTNKTQGLPPGPLCAPSLNAINAALEPTENFAYTYFVTDSNMDFYYTKSLSEHQATIKSLKLKGMWIG